MMVAFLLVILRRFLYEKKQAALVEDLPRASTFCVLTMSIQDSTPSGYSEQRAGFHKEERDNDTQGNNVIAIEFHDSLSLSSFDC